MTKSIGEFINQKHDGIGFHSYNVLSVCDQRVENVKIKYMVCHDDIGSMIRMDIHCEADLVTMSLGTNKTVADRKTTWFTVFAQAVLENGLKDFCIIRVEEFNPYTYKKIDALDEYMIPYIYSDQLEDEAESFCEFYCSDVVYNNGWALPVDQIISEMGIDFYEAPLPEKIFGRMYFRRALENVYEYDTYMIQRLKGKKERHLVKKEITAGTMLINSESFFMGDVGSKLNTIAHEIIHWEKHRKFFEILTLLDDDENNLACVVEPEMAPDHLEGVKKAIWWAEWQANALAPRILMPRTLFLQLFSQVYEEQSQTPYLYLGNVMENTLEKLGMCFGVSKYATKTRAIQLGIDTAEGAFIFVDGKYYPPLSYPKGTLEKNQTFIVDNKSAQAIIASDGSMRDMVLSNAVVYTGSVFCINDPKFIQESSDSERGIELTRYAQDHADECCFIIERFFTRNEENCETELYSVFYLSKDVKASAYVEAHYNPKFAHNQSLEELAREMKSIKNAFAKEREIMSKIPSGFSETIKYHMERKGVSVDALAERSNMSVTTIKKYRNGKVSDPSIDNLMAIFIGLNLSEKYCDDLLTKAGRQLNDTDLHRIYRILIHGHTDGTIEQWNMVLESAGFEKIPKK